MKHISLSIFLAILSSALAFAQEAPRPEDITAIKGQCGCHNVVFTYAEKSAPDKQYTFKDPYTARGTEWVFVAEQQGPANQPTTIVIQHLLVAGDSVVIKHWREDWSFESRDLLTFRQNATWKRVTRPAQQVKGQWAQKVFEVDDSPRYEGSATWNHTNGRHYWESTADAPLPRREYTKRQDYNVMRRTNHHEITATGYVHEQSNDKIIRSESGDQLLVTEKGLNAYTRTSEAPCGAAKAWWAKHKAYWADVRAAWAEVLAGRQDVALRQQVKGMVLSHELDELEQLAVATPGSPAADRDTIKRTILKYLK
ncbi:DUF6607 family protein [Spirosoma utsteinense]|uniref:Secreted protein n=1 Tax=Spirosoma utsteinense TaxID=2585773 RepID=A0ABR6W5B0_9BACT|nr:DUF6607 family protein [Spirosoma utsteinense]MBC3785581.1 hypothetical protein [Spirosoma utsteinense]MBC3791730.1 hypothetical protein [Spirosoma utsteinense]